MADEEKGQSAAIDVAVDSESAEETESGSEEEEEEEESFEEYESGGDEAAAEADAAQVQKGQHLIIFYLHTKFDDSYFSYFGDMIAGVETDKWVT